jgi:hypothetical protein
MKKLRKFCVIWMVLGAMVIAGCGPRISGKGTLNRYAVPADPGCLKNKYNSLECSCKEVDVLYIKWRRLAEKYEKQAIIYNSGS